MTIKPRPNHARYLATLRAMTPSERLEKAFELTSHARQLFWVGLKRRFPHKSEAELRALYVKRLLECSNRNY